MTAVMTKSPWKAEPFVEQFPNIVEKLSLLIDGGAVLDRLFSARIITNDQCIHIRRMVEQKSSSAAARYLLQEILMKGEPSSYETFCEAIRSTDGGQDLHDILVPESAYETGALDTQDYLRESFHPERNEGLLSKSDGALYSLLPEALSQRHDAKVLEVFIVLFLYVSSADTWKLTAHCYHEEKMMKREKKKKKKKTNCICSDYCQFPLTNGSNQNDTFTIQLADHQTKHWTLNDKIVFDRNRLINRSSSIRVVKAKQSPPAEFLQFNAEYKHDGTVCHTETFPFFISSQQSVNTSFVFPPAPERELLPQPRQGEQANTTEEQQEGKENGVQRASESEWIC
ncbi:uncharacterized protein [Oscarella lobularis]|uniref:uncharacterized protein isoform X2 n=1 Tax=Oscarella lobularis TaxID=121494 RepID=UPI0033133188